MRRALCFVAMSLLAVAVQATMWASSKKTDPLTGEKVAANEIISYGGYIYSWPSKYDLVFWPLTDENCICMNPKTGYAAFNDDFEKVAEPEKKALTEWLAGNYKPEQAPRSHKEKLAWLEKVYGQRTKDAEFWCRFYRLMAYIHRDDEKTSLLYVNKALPLLKAKLELKNPEGIERLEVLFLLGEYHRRLGEYQKANSYFSQVAKVEYKEKDGTKKAGHPYFTALVKACQDLKKGEFPKESDAGK